ncbi:glycyl-radical enzyme activating protein [Bacteroidia bacterium]|nr:glycyl-radical enzyme activating protein [Bacteroidia bacterium]
MSIKGTIFNIQTYSIHDGPGIRTVVFLKGCPLRCLWCSNPESQKFTPQVYYSEVRCIHCGSCVSVCPARAVTREQNGVIAIDRESCITCGECAKACPTNAMTITGSEVDAKQLVHEVEKSRSYLMKSGGGVTFSGGEPFAQADFLKEVCAELKRKEYHIAVETCGQISFEAMEQCLENIDIVLFDMKTADAKLHEQGTGKDNRLILENLQRLVGKTNVVIRIPVIPSVNDSDEELKAMATRVFEADKTLPVQLLPYHNLGQSKYKGLGIEYRAKGIHPPEEDRMLRIKQIFTDAGLHCEIL